MLEDAHLILSTNIGSLDVVDGPWSGLLGNECIPLAKLCVRKDEGQWFASGRLSLRKRSTISQTVELVEGFDATQDVVFRPPSSSGYYLAQTGKATNVAEACRRFTTS